jgi:hypothetical protein
MSLEEEAEALSRKVCEALDHICAKIKADGNAYKDPRLVEALTSSLQKLQRCSLLYYRRGTGPTAR